jgi:hypothetical protein
MPVDALPTPVHLDDDAAVGATTNAPQRANVMSFSVIALRTTASRKRAGVAATAGD